ncbi:MAG: hypothetical protein E4H40_04480 [Candidatus Brocadiia bacterium]|nr:MAG: hypothetical protein E4H40_04480 [Candidatus Brocadiia bacterium]
MSIEASLSRYKKNNILIAVILCIGLAIWFGYDGFMNKNFIDKHTTADGKADSTLAFNRKSPPFLAGAAILAGIYFLTIRNKKVVADGKELAVDDKLRISYDSIEKIDKTFFQSKGYFVIGYKNKENQQAELKLSDRTYDNLSAVLDELVAKIS